MWNMGKNNTGLKAINVHSTKINDKIMNGSKSVAAKFNDIFGSIANTISMKTKTSKTNYK